MNNDPNQIADHLIEQHGVDGALEVVRDGVTEAQANGDNYNLSVWRDIRRILQNPPDTGDNEETPNG